MFHVSKPFMSISAAVSLAAFCCSCKQPDMRVIESAGDLKDLAAHEGAEAIVRGPLVQKLELVALTNCAGKVGTFLPWLGPNGIVVYENLHYFGPPGTVKEYEGTELSIRNTQTSRNGLLLIVKHGIPVVNPSLFRIEVPPSRGR